MNRGSRAPTETVSEWQLRLSTIVAPASCTLIAKSMTVWWLTQVWRMQRSIDWVPTPVFKVLGRAFPQSLTTWKCYKMQLTSQKLVKPLGEANSGTTQIWVMRRTFPLIGMWIQNLMSSACLQASNLRWAMISGKLLVQLLILRRIQMVLRGAVSMMYLV